MKDIRSNLIWLIEQSFQGAWVIHGQIGTRQFMGYTKNQAIKKYKEECKCTKIIVNM